MRTVLQKLLHPGMSAMIRERGYSQVSGSVVRAGDAKNLRTASALQEAYGWPSGGSGHVDVVRFEVPLCATLTVPPQVERPWPSYPLGFLRPVGDEIVPVWNMTTTRYSRVPNFGGSRTRANRRSSLCTGGCSRVDRAPRATAGQGVASVQSLLRHEGRLRRHRVRRGHP